jgi:hypothetical protein
MVYEVETFNLIGKTIFLFLKVDTIKLVKEKNMPEKLINIKTGKPVVMHPRREYVQDLKEIQGGEVLNREDFPIYLPYFADVTEDLPGSVKFTPRTWTGCQLLTQKHGGYLEFYHHETEKTLRIAINSNGYEPVK